MTKGDKIFDFEFKQIYSIIAKMKKIGKFTIQIVDECDIEEMQQ